MWDWLTSSLAQRIINIYSSLTVSMKSVLETAKKTPKDFNPTLWNAVQKFNTTIVLPVGWSVLSAFLLLELLNVIKRTDAKGMEAIYFIMIVMIKIGIAKMIMENMTDIILMFFSVANHLLKNSESIFAGAGSSLVMKDSVKAALSDKVAKMDVLSCLGLWITMEIVGFCGKICSLLAQIIVGLRFIEIYVFTAVAAIPMATLVNEKYGDIGVNYLKRMAALALHVIFIVIVLYIYTVLVGAESMFTTSGVENTPFTALGYTILAVIALFQTGNWSKSLLGVH